jgi:hypothetical protein
MEQLLLDVPHHKNTKHWNGKHINFELPRELNRLMVELVTWGRAKILAEVGNASGVGHTLFVHPTKGVPFTLHTVSGYWKQLVLGDLDASKRFGVQLCRSIFVGERRSVNRVEGPVDRAAAMVMGHCEKVWNTNYDRQYSMRNAAQCIQAMQGWREGLLTRHRAAVAAAAAAGAPPAPPAAPAATAAAGASPVGAPEAQPAVAAAAEVMLTPPTAPVGPALLTPAGLHVAGLVSSMRVKSESQQAGACSSDDGSSRDSIIDLCDSD